MTQEELEAKVKELETNNADLVSSIGKLEKANMDLVGERTTLKQKLKDGVTDEELKAENEKLMAVIESNEAKSNELEVSHRSEVNEMKIISMFDALGIEADSDEAKELLIPLLKEGSDFAEDGFRYIDSENTTVFKDNNRKYDLMDRVNDLRESGYGGLFQPQVGGGATDTTTAPTPNTDMSAQGRADYFKTHGVMPKG